MDELIELEILVDGETDDEGDELIELDTDDDAEVAPGTKIAIPAVPTSAAPETVASAL